MQQRIAWGCLLTIAIASLMTIGAEGLPTLVIFHEEGCPSCLEMEEFLSVLTFDAPEGTIDRYEISEPGAMELLVSLARSYDIEVPHTVPIVFIDDEVFVGAVRADEFRLSDIVTDCLREGCESPIARLPASQLRADLPRLALMLAAFLALAWLQLR